MNQSEDEDACPFSHSTVSDFSNRSFYEANNLPSDWLDKKPTFPYVAAVVSTILTLSTVGNGLILFILLTRKKIRNNSPNLVIGNMAFADLICCFLVSARAIGRNYEHNYILGPGFCYYDSFFKDVLMYVSDLSLLLMCYERLKVLWWPISRDDPIKFVYYKCTVMWLYAILVRVNELFNYHTLVKTRWSDFTECSCQVHEDVKRWVEFVMAGLCIYVPAILTSVLYILFLREIKKLCASRSPASSIEERTAKERMRVYETQIAVMIIVNLAFTWISWFPEQYLFLGHSTSTFTTRFDADTERWYLAYHVLVALRCMVNPLIYGFANQSFRREVSRLLPFRERSLQADQMALDKM